MNGKAFEKEVSLACKAASVFFVNPNDPNPVCDKIGCYRRTIGNTSIGISLLIEAKECRTSRFKFSRISDRERTHLNAHLTAGGLGLILIKLVSSRPRAWGVPWEDWLELEDGCGYDAGSVRQLRGSASISLMDGLRPATLIELEKISRLNSLGNAWDLRPLLTEIQ